MFMKNKTLILMIVILLLGEKMMANDKTMKEAVFAAGCFWGVESSFQALEGVKETTVGYTGGKVKNPSYELVCTGITGHAEAVKVIYDASVVSYEQLLNTFFTSHDPTTLNRQGPDVGTQYRSAIYFADESEREAAESIIEELNESGKFSSKIVTEVTNKSDFYDAEEYHQDYYQKRGLTGCAI
jgi:peptide-methionine (S)-S-oxide reductase